MESISFVKPEQATLPDWGERPIEVSAEESSAPKNSAAARVTFSRDDGSGDFYVRVVNRETGETIREVPSQSARQMRELMEKKPSSFSIAV